MQPIVIFTDGACSGNPGPGGWGSIISFADGSVREIGGGDPSTTNNRMEMTATIRALALLETPVNTDKITIYTDSTYVIKGITQWVHGWRARGWKTAEGNDVANKDLWEEIMRQVMRIKPAVLDWKYVRGHAGFDGNERCDEIAVAFSKNLHIALYEGPREAYTVNLNSLPAESPLPARKDSKPSGSTGGGGGSVCYLSNVSGVVVRHKTWAACERRVKGVAAKFKKIKNKQEETELLRSWGFDSRVAILDD